MSTGTEARTATPSGPQPTPLEPDDLLALLGLHSGALHQFRSGWVLEVLTQSGESMVEDPEGVARGLVLQDEAAWYVYVYQLSHAVIDSSLTVAKYLLLDTNPELVDEIACG